MTGPARRRFMQSASVGVAGLAAGATLQGAAAQAQPAGYDADAMAAEISARLFAPSEARDIMLVLTLAPDGQPEARYRGSRPAFRGFP